MLPSSDDHAKDALFDALKKWDKSLVLVSLPHTAALSAFIGRYDLAKDEMFFLSFPIFMITVTAWIFLVDMRLRDEFLQAHPKYNIRVFSQMRHFLFMLYPPMLFVIAEHFSLRIDRNTLGLMCMTLMSWLLCVLAVSSYLHWLVMRKARAL